MANHTTSRESYGIAKAIVTNFMESLTTNAAAACSFFAHNSSLIWTSKDEEYNPLIGKHSIFNFLQQLPVFKHEVKSYDVHSVIVDPPLTVVIVCGTLTFPNLVGNGKLEIHSFHMTAHVVQVGTSAAIKSLCMKIKL